MDFEMCHYRPPKYPSFAEFIASMQPQYFSLPATLIYYITKNPRQSKVYQKTIQTCKHFFAKNPILVFHCFRIADGQWMKCDRGRNGNNCIEGDHNDIARHMAFYFPIPFNAQNLGSCKIWIVNIARIDYDNSDNIVSELAPKIYQCDAPRLSLSNQKMSLKQFMLLSKNVKMCHLGSVIISSRTCPELPIEEIIANLPKIKSFSYVFGINPISSDTVKNLLQISHFKRIKSLFLDGVPQNLDIQTFYYNYYRKKKFTLLCSFRYRSMESEVYKKKVEEIIDKILNAPSYRLKAPYICFPGMNAEKRKAIDALFLKYHKGGWGYYYASIFNRFH